MANRDGESRRHSAMRAVAPLLLWLTLAPTLARASAHAYARDSLYATNDAAILVAGA